VAAYLFLFGVIILPAIVVSQFTTHLDQQAQPFFQETQRVIASEIMPLRVSGEGDD